MPAKAVSRSAPSCSSAWAPIGVRQVAPSPSTSARSAVRQVRAGGSVSAPAAAATGASSVRASSARHPWPGAGTSSGSRTPSAPRPSRSSPACASTSAAKSPSARRRRRVSTLPRSSRTSRSGRSASSWARRRRLLVPTARAVGQLPQRGRPAERVERVRALRHADDGQAGGQLGGYVLGGVHRQVDLAGEERVLDLLDEAGLVQPGAARLDPRRSRSAPARRLAGEPPATRRACASASALPRVPSRITDARLAGGASSRVTCAGSSCGASAASRPKSSCRACT